MSSPPLKIAIVHDWLVSYRGGEKVVEAIAELFPGADFFTLFHRPGTVGTELEQRKITTSFLNKLPFAHSHHRHFLPLMPLAIESFDMNGYDLIISSSHCVAKGIIPGPDAVHICYCHTPMRYAWDKRREYFRSAWQRILAAPILHYLRMWDVTSSRRVDSFIANSHWVGKRIQKYYGRPSQVVFPFVDDFFLAPSDQPREDFYLVVSGFAPYKRIDLAIDACTRLRKRLVVVGSGQDRKRLEKLVSPHIEFAGQVAPSELRRLYQTARALLFPGEEDFGISPLEAMAAGCPIIAYGKGGLTETVKEGETGLFFKEQTAESLGQAITIFETNRFPITPNACRKRAAEFSKARFQREFLSHLERVLGQKLSSPMVKVEIPPA